jgi:hypothetical protein
MIEAIRSSETSVLTSPTRRHIPVNGILSMDTWCHPDDRGDTFLRNVGSDKTHSLHYLSTDNIFILHILCLTVSSHNVSKAIVSRVRCGHSSVRGAGFVFRARDRPLGFLRRSNFWPFGPNVVLFDVLVCVNTYIHIERVNESLHKYTQVITAVKMMKPTVSIFRVENQPNKYPACSRA